MISFITDKYTIDPLGIAYLSAMLKSAGFSAKLLLTSDLDRTQIDTPIVGYSTTTGKHKYYAAINRRLKQANPSLLSIFGGPHCTFYPKFAMEEDIDFIFSGECFESIVDFARRYAEGKRLTDTSNIVYYSNGKLIQNQLLPPFNVANLPFPDRQLIYQFKHNRENPIKNVMASFYCPMNCTYCFNKQFKKLGYKPAIRPVESVIEECMQLKANYPLELIYFQDDIFPVYNKDWLHDFCAGFSANIKFHIQVRIEMLNEDIIRMLKAVGLHSLTFAIENADAEIRERLLGRRITNDAIRKNVALLHKYNIPFRIENMLGIPTDSFETALETLKFNIACKPAIGWASLYTPYRGTDLGDYCYQQNIVSKEINGDFFSHSPLQLEDGSRIEKLQKLFALVCSMPSLKRFLPLLTVLPCSYKLVYKLIKQYLYRYKLFKVC